MGLNQEVNNTLSLTQLTYTVQDTAPPPEPVPTLRFQLMAIKKKAYNELLVKYKFEYKKYLVQECGYKKIHMRIQESVYWEFLLVYCKSTDLHDILIALQNWLEQMLEQKENELLRHWTNLKEGKKGHDIKMWLQK